MGQYDQAYANALQNPQVKMKDKPAKRGAIVVGQTTKRKSKYNAVKVDHDGIRFDSKAERDRYITLALNERAGLISALTRQPEFLLPAGIKYRADFRYLENGRVVVEDVKGMATEAFKIKWKLVRHFNPNIIFRIVRNGKVE